MGFLEGVSRRYVRFEYDFAVDGGAQGDITLRGPAIPSGTVVVGATVDVTTAVTSGGAATVALKLEGTADLRAAATLSTAPALNAQAVKALLSPVKTSASRSVVATIATADLTAGKFTVLLETVQLS
ncbi:hypothetical protein [Streptomyces sp. NPDC101150]|uniref:hypothetical protein n=1 Tax=Streptomyces sp. NPDC101150 TaxID=3366114 RepID=UPI0037F45CB6